MQRGKIGGSLDHFVGDREQRRRHIVKCVEDARTARASNGDAPTNGTKLKLIEAKPAKLRRL